MALLCPSTRIHFGSKEQLIQLLEILKNKHLLEFFASSWDEREGRFDSNPGPNLSSYTGSGIPSLVGDFGLKVIKCGANSSLLTSSASRKGDRGDPDFRSLLYEGRIPIISSLSSEGDKGEGPNMFYPQPLSVIIKREIAPKETTCDFLGYAQSGYRRYDVKSKRLDLMLWISLTLQAALLSIFYRFSAYSADLRGFQSLGITCLFSKAITVSFPGEDLDKEEEQKLHRQDSLQVEGHIGALRSPVISSKKRNMKGFTPRLMDQEMNERLEDPAHGEKSQWDAFVERNRDAAATLPEKSSHFLI
uniref:Uncharacterized protein n=1 Tax=Tanacetum cinerariifolium TaxID=118510 RepID=A0A6L2JE43_TANCI|nr:uncharacterized protein [Tanacetum cinerariifolium]